MKLFLSYTMRDGNVTVQHLSQASDALCAFGPVFADAIHNSDTDRQARVEKEISECDLVVYIETKAFRESSWVNREQEIAHRLRKKTVSVRWLEGDDWEGVLSSLVEKVGEEAVANNRVESYNMGRASAFHVEPHA